MGSPSRTPTHRGAAAGAPPAPAEADVGTATAAVDLGPLTERLGYLLRRAQIAVFQDFFATFASYDIRPAQYSTLAVIEANPGLSQTRVADALGIQKTNFVSMIGALERRSLVRREPSPTDRRTYCLFLTQQGAALVAQLHAVARDHEKRLAALVGEEAYAALFAPLRRIAEDLRGPSEP